MDPRFSNGMMDPRMMQQYMMQQQQQFYHQQQHHHQQQQQQQPQFEGQMPPYNPPYGPGSGGVLPPPHYYQQQIPQPQQQQQQQQQLQQNQAPSRFPSDWMPARVHFGEAVERAMIHVPPFENADHPPLMPADFEAQFQWKQGKNDNDGVLQWCLVLK
jgi:hypothetical protein